MEAIVFTDQEAAGLINEYFTTTPYRSLKKFKNKKKRSMAMIPLKNGLNMLSVTVLDDPVYEGLRDFILGRTGKQPTIREVTPDELPDQEI